jgi:hypothetical protein
MGAYTSCSSCKGRGHFSCEECICKTCQDSGKVKCKECVGGKTHCYFCRGTGQIEKHGWVFTKRETCPDCRGSKKITCKVCSGSDKTSCAACSGKGRNATCWQCKGTHKIGCKDCAGSGRVESEWYKSLKTLPVDRLRYEQEKRQREVSNLYTQVSRVSRELDEMYRYYEEDRQMHPNRYNAAGSYPSGLDSLPREINSLESRISDLNDEISTIDQVISEKWK